MAVRYKTFVLAPIPTSTLSPASANLRWLFFLRNIAIAGQILAVSTTLWILEIPLPVTALACVIAAVGALNVVTWFRLRRSAAVTSRELTLQLALDVLALAGVLYFAGGGTNPFTWLLLLPLVLAATVLPRRFTWTIAGLSVLCYSLLMVYYVPFPYPDTHHGQGFGLHVFGMWIGFVLCAGVVAYFLTGVAETLRARERSLAEAREQALRDERVIAMGTLAAGAAHELGTPLGTIAVLAEELEQEYSEEPFADLHSRLQILREQVDRCKDALSVISAAAGEPRMEAGGLMTVDAYLSDLVKQWLRLRPGVSVRCHVSGVRPTPHILAERTLTQALLSILDNAADASPSDVTLEGRWNDSELVIDVGDRGEGLTGDAKQRAGKDVYTTKPEGLGLGLFLAHAAIERLGGRVSLTNREDGGALTRLIVPLTRLQTGSGG